MQYLGLDVHVKATVWCLLDETGETVERGKVPTTAPALQGLLERLSQSGAVLAGQESGKMSYFVHDVVNATGVKLLTFNPYHLRMIAASRKKTDRRDAYWLAKALQTGMTPHPVYIPTGEVRQLRAMLSERDIVAQQRRAWLARTVTLLQSAGLDPGRGRGKGWLQKLLNQPDGLDQQVVLAVERCDRMARTLSEELDELDARLHQRAKAIEAVQRLQTIPAVGEKVALTIYAWVGDVARFHTARQLCSYAGVVPGVRQSGESSVNGAITKQGSSQLRRILVLAGHVLLFRCQSQPSRPLQAKPERVAITRGRRKVAVTAAARHILRIAFYVLRDQTDYNPALLNSGRGQSKAA